MGALIEQACGALGGADAAADAACGLAARSCDKVVVGAVADGGVEIDDLDLGEGGELFEHGERAVAFERLLAALDELDDFAVHQIDAGDDH